MSDSRSGLLGWFRGIGDRHTAPHAPRAADIRLEITSSEPSGSMQRAVASQPRPSMATLSYLRRSKFRSKPFDTGRRQANYNPPQFNLNEISAVITVESILQTSIERHVEMALTEVSLVGKPEHVRYLSKRLAEIELMSDQSFRELLADQLYQVAAYGTAITVVRRDTERSSGHAIRYFKRKLQPIAAMFVADAPSMEVAVNDGGNVTAWRQTIRGAEKPERTFSRHDVFVAARHRRPGMIFGTPYCISVLDDIMVLRRLEELLDIVSQKHVFPLFQIMVGTDQLPAGDHDLGGGQSISEIEYVSGLVNNMPTEGAFVTSHRWQFEMIGAKGEVLDLMPYVAHFYSRVTQGLRMNQTVLGTDGSGSSTKGQATHQMQALAASARHLQKVVADSWRVILRQLLFEGGFNLTWEDQVTLQFAHPDEEAQRAHENHLLAQYQGDMRTQAEARQGMGLPALTPEQKKDMFLEKQSARDVELATKTAAARPAAGSSSSSKKAKSSSRSTATRSRPTNQSGTKSTKTRSTANDELTLVPA